MASAIFFGGRRINVPGAYSEIDASELAGLAPGAVGIVALLGEAEGGKPLTVETEFADATRPETLLKRHRSGDLRIAGQFCFQPSTDPAVPGGAQRVVGVKVNPATRSALQLVDDNSDACADLLSADWGQFTEQINIEIEAGTNEGKKYTVVFENKVETFDDVGNDPVLDVLYTPGSNGFTTMTGQITSSLFRALATKVAAGLATGFTQPTAGVLTVVSANAGDTTQTVTIYGLDGTDPVSETLSLNGVTPVVGVQSFTKVTGVIKSAAALGNVTITDTLAATVVVLAPATLTAGLSVLTNAPAASAVVVSIDVDTAVDLVIRGLNAAGGAVAERVDLTTAASVPVTTTAVFSRITHVELADVAAARTVTLSLTAAQTSHSTFPNTRTVADRLNILDGFTANSLRRNSFLMVDADYRPAQSLLTTAREFFADLFDFIDTMNSSSQYIRATRATAGSLPPANTSGVLYLAGGSEGTTTIAEWQTAINLLKKRRVNTIVPLTNDPAVHALLSLHLVERAGKLRSEANGYVGVGKNDGSGETRSAIKSQLQLLNTRHLTGVAQECKRFDPDTGIATFYPPHYFAAIAAGMQAGSPIGEPLTRKRPFVSDIRNDPSWTVEDDVEEMIDAGLMVAENVDGVGIRFVRSVTTHLDDDNPVFTEMSANESANTAIFELRRQLDQRIGRRGIRGSVATIKGLAFDVLERLVTDNIIVAFRSVTVEQIGDTFPVSVELAPVLPINFIPVTVHLVAVRAAA